MRRVRYFGVLGVAYPGDDALFRRTINPAYAFYCGNVPKLKAGLKAIFWYTRQRVMHQSAVTLTGLLLANLVYY